MMSDETREGGPLLSPEIQSDLSDLRAALLEGRDTNAKNLVAHLRIEVMAKLEDVANAYLSQQLDALEAQLALPRNRRFKEPKPERRHRRPGFMCAFCRQRWAWDAAMEIPNRPAYACTNCAKTVMCQVCGAREAGSLPHLLPLRWQLQRRCQATWLPLVAVMVARRTASGAWGGCSSVSPRVATAPGYEAAAATTCRLHHPLASSRIAS